MEQGSESRVLVLSEWVEASVGLPSFGDVITDPLKEDVQHM
ncbi:hypothetical protein [Arthrobacter sp. 35W]|nr:hypothetical protein [Arthrobacter sp. 35W]